MEIWLWFQSFRNFGEIDPIYKVRIEYDKITFFY